MELLSYDRWLVKYSDSKDLNFPEWAHWAVRDLASIKKTCKALATLAWKVELDDTPWQEGNSVYITLPKDLKKRDKLWLSLLQYEVCNATMDKHDQVRVQFIGD